ncbi:MAG TPA: DUF3149 domain-containing protein [Thiobacillaceae bacterium]|nr:DUF3149 domain-containing protein [Thiobacillaceae bacterium]
MSLLFKSPIGLLSLFTIGFLIAMGLFLWAKISKKAREGD